MMNTYTKYLKNKGHSSSTVKEYYRQLCAWINWVEARGGDPEREQYKDIQAYMEQLQGRGMSQDTVYMHVLAIRHYYEWRQELGQQEHNPAQHIRVQGKKDNTVYPPLTQAELHSMQQRYAAQAPTGLTAPQRAHNALQHQRNQTILGLLIHQGLSVAEIENLQTTDVDLKRGTITIREHGKGAGRELTLEGQQIMGLLAYSSTIRGQLLAKLPTAQQQQAAGYYYITSHHAKVQQGAYNNKSLLRHLSVQLKKIEPRFESYHQIRTSAIVHWLGRYHLRQVQQMAGHRRISTTERYQFNDLQSLTEGIRHHHPLDELL